MAQSPFPFTPAFAPTHSANTGQSAALNNLLPQQKANKSGNGKLIGNVLADLQKGYDFNVSTSATQDGGYCIKFNTKKPQHATNIQMNGDKKVKPKDMEPSTSKQYYRERTTDRTPGMSGLNKRSKSKSPAPRPRSAQRTPKPEAPMTAAKVDQAGSGLAQLADKLEIDHRAMVHNLPAPKVTQAPLVPTSTTNKPATTYRNRHVSEALQNQKDSGKPAMLVCVLFGPSVELMKISDMVQDKASKSGVTVRMNAPVH